MKRKNQKANFKHKNYRQQSQRRRDCDAPVERGRPERTNVLGRHRRPLRGPQRHLRGASVPLRRGNLRLKT